MKLLKVIKNPVTNHLPVGCKKLVMSFSAQKVIHPRELVPADEPIAIVVGAMAHGQVSTFRQRVYNRKIFCNSLFPVPCSYN